MDETSEEPRGVATVTLIGVLSAMLLFQRAPEAQTGAGTVTASPSFRSSPTPGVSAASEDDYIGGTTTVENARKYAGFKLLVPTSVPDSLQLSAAILNRIFPRRDFTACSRLGVCTAFSGSFLGWRLIPSKGRYLIPPQAANASR